MTHLIPPPRYAQVLVDLDAKTLDRRTFSYAIPAGMEQAIEIGTPVQVPFGRMKSITGYIVGFAERVDAGIRVRDILDILDDVPLFDLAYLEFLDWIAQYYATPLMTVLATALPSSMIQKTRRDVILQTDSLPDDYLNQQSAAARHILGFLKSRPAGKGLRVRFVASQTGLPLKLVNQTLYQLQHDGVVRLQSQSTAKMACKTMTWVRRVTAEPGQPLTKRQTEVMAIVQATLTDDTPKPLSEVSTLAQTTPMTLQKLAQMGVLDIFDAPQNREQGLLSGYHQTQGLPDLALNPEQILAASRVLQAAPGSTHLLYGVTGSGKTEVYMRLTETMLAEGKTVLILVPEISLTSHIAKRFIARFGLDQTALWHSHLSAGEKVDAWRRIHSGNLKIVIGARSAIFAPLQNLGLIVMDEEHEGSFKQDSPAPRYHAKTLAQQLVQRLGAKLLLGSATPDVESFYQAKADGSLLTLAQRYGGRAMADVHIVDMRAERQNGVSGALSTPLRQALSNTLASGAQAILLLNRRGFYTVITCQDCDETLECPHCTVALTYHRNRDQVQCHYCGYDAPKPQYCPKCASFSLSFGGIGTQRLETEVAEAYPEARLLRLDSDILQKKFAHRDILDAFAAHEADILIGTQMVAKGLDVPNVTLVGVIGADTTFSLPDYKASERGFQLLTQVAGRSGRGDKPGQVIIQTTKPEHPVILRAREQDYTGFYEDELLRRNAFDFPPYSQLFRLIASCPDEFRARSFMQAMARNLQQVLEAAGIFEKISLLGPAPCVIARIQARYRYHLMIKNHAGPSIHPHITHFFKAIQPPEDLNFLLDVDAQSFL